MRRAAQLVTSNSTTTTVLESGFDVMDGELFDFNPKSKRYTSNQLGPSLHSCGPFFGREAAATNL